MNADGGLPLITMSALLMTLGIAAIFLLYRYLKTLQQQHDRYLHIINNTPAALLWFDPSGQIIGANNAFLRLSGYRIDQLRGQPWTERFLPDESALRISHLLKNGHGEISAFPSVFIHADGTWSQVMLAVTVKGKTGIVSVSTCG